MAGFAALVACCAFSPHSSYPHQSGSHLHTPRPTAPPRLHPDVRASASDSAAALELLDRATERLLPHFADVDRRTEHQLRRVLRAFRTHKVGTHHFAGVDGYGHGDLGRETLDELYAELMGAEDAVVRVQCFSGTHAIACALYGVLRPGHEMLAVSGAPYDTLEEVIGLRDGRTDGLTGTLKDFGVSYRQLELTPEGCFDLEAISASLAPATRLLHVQRSCGYSWRPSIPIAEIRRLCEFMSKIRPEVIIFVDNCYGEFVEEEEPCHVGAHLVAGSLIKNPGGTLALTGGYVAGRADLVAAAKRRLSCPGVEGGATLGQNRAMFQGLFHAPHVVGEALKGAMLVAEVMCELGYECNPPRGSNRTDIIQAVRLGSKDKVLALCRAVQRSSPVGSYILPTEGVTPGYGDPVVFADGTFVDGSTLELSADGPLRAPFVAYMQGGTHWTHWRIVLSAAFDTLLEAGLALESEAQGQQAEQERRYAGRRSMKNN